jgi:hypothetical protein
LDIVGYVDKITGVIVDGNRETEKEKEDRRATLRQARLTTACIPFYHNHAMHRIGGKV